MVTSGALALTQNIAMSGINCGVSGHNSFSHQTIETVRAEKDGDLSRVLRIH
jgi:hypothetical protein